MTTLKIGDKAPNFEGIDQDGLAHTLSDYGAKAQANFKTKQKLPYNLLADENKSVIEAFGVWGPKKFMGKEYDGIHRTTFVIDENGIIEDIITKVKTKEHSAQLLK